jgi:hypothetical protein
MAYILLGLFFNSSHNHVLLTFFPYDQLFNQLRIHNCSPIHRLSMICFGDHHGKLITKILHLIFFINNGVNCTNLIYIVQFHFLHNPLLIGVVSIWNPISYVCQCYFSISNFSLICLYFSCMEKFKNLCCHNLSLGLVTKAKACKGVGQERSLGV